MAKQTPKPRQRKRYYDADQSVALLGEDNLYRILEAQSTPFLLILDGVQDPHNLGACLRTAAAAGVHAVIAPKDRSAGLTPTVRDVARGGAESVPFIQVTNLARVMRDLQDKGVWMVGTTHLAEESIYDLDLTGSLAIVMGSEGKGVRRLTLDHCDFRARIPMVGQVDCLNVSVAAGICLFEALRQRKSTPRG